jgi:phage shock protein A
MRVQPPAEYSIKKYQEQCNALKEASDKVFQEGLQMKAEITEFYKKLEEIKAKNKKGVLTKEAGASHSVDIYV